MAKSEKKLTPAQRHQVFESKEAMAAFTPPPETAGGNPITWRQFQVGKAFVYAVNDTDAVRRAYLGKCLPIEVVEIVVRTPAEAKAVLDSLTAEERAKLLKSYKA